MVKAEHMRILLVADTFYPEANSAANQLYDLAIDLSERGVEVSVLAPVSSEAMKKKLPQTNCLIHDLRFKRLINRNTRSNTLRVTSEIISTFQLITRYFSSSRQLSRSDILVWYSPSIFLVFFVYFCRIEFKYLILRDLFPDWAVNVGILRNRLLIYILRKLAGVQFKLATVVGVQSQGDKSILLAKYGAIENCTVLKNWLGDRPDISRVRENHEVFQLIDSIKEEASDLFVHAGNLGPAQDAENLIRSFCGEFYNSDQKLILIGKGREYSRLETYYGRMPGVYFLGELPPDLVPQLLVCCYAGVVSLSNLHQSNNIPGKYLEYLRSGLPVFALTGRRTDLHKEIESESQIGMSVINGSAEAIFEARQIFREKKRSGAFSESSIREFFRKNYSVQEASESILRQIERP